MAAFAFLSLRKSLLTSVVGHMKAWENERGRRCWRADGALWFVSSKEAGSACRYCSIQQLLFLPWYPDSYCLRDAAEV